MAINKTPAIILYSRKQGETSKILSMLTEHFGKQEIIAKGSRGIKSKYLGVLEPYNYISIVFYRKESREFQYLSQADGIERFPSLHQELGKLSLAAIPCEIVQRSERTGHKNPQLFFLLLETLRALDAAESGLKNILRFFYLHFLNISGFGPELSQCSICGSTAPDKNYFFELDNGIYNCTDCGILTEYSTLISGKTLEYLRWLSRADLRKVTDVKIPASTGLEMDTVLLAYMRYHVEGLLNLKSIEHLEQLLNKLKK